MIAGSLTVDDASDAVIERHKGARSGQKCIEAKSWKHARAVPWWGRGLQTVFIYAGRRLQSDASLYVSTIVDYFYRNMI
jgi:hypothetical protein